MGTINFNRLIIISAIFYQNLAIYYLADTCSAQNVSAFFVFGDSLVEVGNNFYIKTIVQPRYPNGFDFDNGTTPSRRFTNGRTAADIIGKFS